LDTSRSGASYAATFTAALASVVKRSTFLEANSLKVQSGIAGANAKSERSKDQLSATFVTTLDAMADGIKMHQAST
jgi:hypothetical protein